MKLVRIVVGMLLLAATSAAAAQVIKLIVPTAPGGGTDGYFRILAKEATPFIKGVNGGYVRFDWRGRHGVLLDRITPEDVHWIAERLTRLTDGQWHDAFRAGGYAPELAERFIRRFKQKIEEGLAVGR